MATVVVQRNHQVVETQQWTETLSQLIEQLRQVAMADAMTREIPNQRRVRLSCVSETDGLAGDEVAAAQ